MSSIVAISFFPAFRPAANGAELRLGNLYRVLSENNDVTLVTSTHFGARLEEIQHGPGFRELRFPQDDFWRNAYAALERTRVMGRLSGLAFALAVSDVCCPLRIRVRELAASCDYVIHESPYSEPIFSDRFECTEIYNSRDLEASLLSSTLRGEGVESALLKLIRLEQNLVSRCRRVFVTSLTAGEKLRLLYGAERDKLVICPNGFDPSELKLSSEAKAATNSARPKIASTVSTDLDSPQDSSKSRRGADKPTVLALNDYPVIAQHSGGATRVRQLLTHIDCDVTLISFGGTLDVCPLGDGFAHITVPKTSAHQAFESAANAGQTVSVNDAVASLLIGANRILSCLVAALLPRIDAVIFEHPYMAPALDAIATARPDLPIIYSAHNVEASLKAQILRQHALGATLLEFISALERRLASDAHLIVCCTEADARCFRELNDNVLVVPNGCTIPEVAAPRLQAEAPVPIARVGFLGSAHAPNVEAARFIVGELATAIPTVQFSIVGSVCSALDGKQPANVTLHGLVSEEKKSSILRQWDIALNPVLSGGGSSLKLPDYLAHGLATLSTPAGARGFAVTEYDAGRVVSRTEFPASLSEMLKDRDSLVRQRQNAYRYATEQLNWNVVTLPYRQRIRGLLEARASARREN